MLNIQNHKFNLKPTTEEIYPKVHSKGAQSGVKVVVSAVEKT